MPDLNRDSGQHIAETARLTLRCLGAPDQVPLAAVFGDPEVMRFGPGLQTQAWVAHWLADSQDSYRTYGFGPWAVVSRVTGTILGYCGLFAYPDLAGRPEVELGYRLARTAWGQGYATEAARAARDYAFHTLGLTRLVALIDPDNLGSRRVAEKLGMHIERTVMLPSYSYPDLLFSITCDTCPTPEPP